MCAILHGTNSSNIIKEKGENSYSLKKNKISKFNNNSRT